jgi:hypothetical protein
MTKILDVTLYTPQGQNLLTAGIEVKSILVKGKQKYVQVEENDGTTTIFSGLPFRVNYK